MWEFLNEQRREKVESFLDDTLRPKQLTAFYQEDKDTLLELEALKMVIRGEVKLHRLDDLTHDPNRAAKIRRTALEVAYGADLSAVGKHTIDFNDAVNRNIENPIGATQIPLGITDPLKVKGDYADGMYVIPIATHEGRRVAGLNKGISVINESGGVETVVLKDAMTRAPAIRAPRARDARKYARWLEDNFQTLKEEFESTTRHGKLLRVKPYQVGRDVYPRFEAFTGSAMGMNMVTIGTSHAISKTLPKAMKDLGIELDFITESSNLCTDKKPAYIDMLEGRGVSVVADVEIPEDIIEKRYGVDLERMMKVHLVKNYQGSALAGSHGYNAHIANIVSSIFLATGQDEAQVVESSQGITTMENEGDHLYASVTLPSLEVATYGGGTRRETQKEILKMQGLYGEGDDFGYTRLALAEIISAACLAGEVNLIGTQAGLKLAYSHKTIKRG